MFDFSILLLLCFYFSSINTLFVTKRQRRYDTVILSVENVLLIKYRTRTTTNDYDYKTESY